MRQKAKDERFQEERKHCGLYPYVGAKIAVFCILEVQLSNPTITLRVHQSAATVH